jgi:hypothetical protein
MQLDPLPDGVDRCSHDKMEKSASRPPCETLRGKAASNEECDCYKEADRFDAIICFKDAECHLDLSWNVWHGAPEREKPQPQLLE